MANSPNPDKTRASKKRPTPYSVRHFHDLPDQARLNSRSLRILLGISSSTLWRRQESGQIKKPDIGGTWSVGYVRELLGE